MNRPRPAIPRSCLLFGYCGNRNTGSDVRMLTIIEDVRAVFGPDTLVTVVSQDREITRTVVKEGPNLRIVEIPFGEPLLFGNRVQRQVMKHDVTFLIEGSALQQNFSPWLLYAYLWTAFAAWLAGRPCVAYAVDVGDLTPFNRWLVVRACGFMDLVITRTERARERLLAMGFRGRVLTNTDTAFQFLSHSAPRTEPLRDKPLVGIAPIEFYHWPVQLRLWGRREDRYRWPYHFTWTAEGRQRSRDLIAVYAAFIQECVDQRGLDVALIAMEQLDTRFCQQILEALPVELRQRVRLVSSRETAPVEMTLFLRGLDYLVTSRYHASVLSLAGGVPQLAIAHDERIESIYREAGIVADCLLPHQAPDLAQRLSTAFTRLQERRCQTRQHLLTMYQEQFLPRCLHNRDDLQTWVEQRKAALSPAIGST